MSRAVLKGAIALSPCQPHLGVTDNLSPVCSSVPPSTENGERLFFFSILPCSRCTGEKQIHSPGIPVGMVGLHVIEGGLYSKSPGDRKGVILVSRIFYL